MHGGHERKEIHNIKQHLPLVVAPMEKCSPDALQQYSNGSPAQQGCHSSNLQAVYK